MAMSKCFYDLACDLCVRLNCTYVQFKEFSLCVPDRTTLMGNGQVVTPPHWDFCPTPSPLPPCDNSAAPWTVFVPLIITNTTMEVAKAVVPAIVGLALAVIALVVMLVVVAGAAMWIGGRQQRQIRTLRAEARSRAPGTSSTTVPRRTSPILAGNLQSKSGPVLSMKAKAAAAVEKLKLPTFLKKKDDLSVSRRPLLNSTLNTTVGSVAPPKPSRSAAAASSSALSTFIEDSSVTSTTVVVNEPEVGRLISFVDGPPSSSVVHKDHIAAMESVKAVSGVGSNNPFLKRPRAVVVEDYNVNASKMEEVD